MAVVDEQAPAVPSRTGIKAGQRTPWQVFTRFCRRNPRIPIFTGLVLALFIPGLLAPLIAPYSPREPNTRIRLQGPSARHLLGTDQLGRDTFTRVLYGGRVSIPVGLLAVVVSAGLGISLGILSGFFGGLIDTITGRLVDAQLAFPELILAIAVVNAFGASLVNVMLIVGLGRFPGYYRLTRGQVLQAREFEYVTAARALGASSPRLMLQHILPNILNPLLITTSFAAGGAVLTLSALGFVGLGPKAGQPDWGAMFNEALTNFRLQPWMVFGPGMAVFLTVLSFYVLGDALRDWLDPHRRGRAP